MFPPAWGGSELVGTWRGLGAAASAACKGGASGASWVRCLLVNLKHTHGKGGERIGAHALVGVSPGFAKAEVSWAGGTPVP